MDGQRIKAFVLGGSGYVAGELLRLLLQHPVLEAAAVVSTSQAGEPVAQTFPHLKGTGVEPLSFISPEQLGARFERGQTHALFAATPHGATAALVDRALADAERAGATLRAVDLSADFRFADPERYRAIYGKEHAAPQRIPSFVCAVPDCFAGTPPRHATQPGCFTTAVTCGALPFYALGLVEGPLFASAVTGSTGSGRKLSEGTHHPERRSNLFAYSPLGHRHEQEMAMLVGNACGGKEPEVEFVPHSGPFARGIHATLRMTLRESAKAAALVSRVNAFYEASPFVHAGEKPPRLIDVVGTNRCDLGVFTRGRTLVVTSCIDNLVKGAAGGGIQWMNRLLGLDEDAGLRLGGLGWI